MPQFFLENGYTTFGAGKIFHGGPSSNHNDVEFSWSKGPEVPFGFRDQYPDPYPELGYPYPELDDPYPELGDPDPEPDDPDPE